MKFKKKYKYLNPDKYVKVFSNPTWYLDLKKELLELFYQYDGDKTNKTQEWLDYRYEFIAMVYELFEAGKIALADSGADEDEERKSIDTVVIHHTGSGPNIPVSALNVLGLIRLYAPRFSSKKAEQYGRAIWSNHFWKGKPNFIAYHYIIRPDGTYEHLLKDNEIGWHCGNWDYNCRSIAIAFQDDLLDKAPSDKAIETANEIVAKYLNCTILGHREILPSTLCPGNTFLGDEGWKKKLRSNVNHG